jgi:peroxiredoxin Q/BCP
LLREGESAPDFTLESSDGKTFKLYEELGKQKYLVLFFFPKANTPGCTREAARFQELVFEFKKLSARVVGISVDNPGSQEKFSSKLGLTYILLSDKEKKASSLYGVLRERGTSAERVTFIIDSSGRILRVIKNVKPEEHPELALEFLRSVEGKQ